MLKHDYIKQKEAKLLLLLAVVRAIDEKITKANVIESWKLEERREELVGEAYDLLSQICSLSPIQHDG